MVHAFLAFYNSILPYIFYVWEQMIIMCAIVPVIQFVYYFIDDTPKCDRKLWTKRLYEKLPPSYEESWLAWVALDHWNLVDYLITGIFIFCTVICGAVLLLWPLMIVIGVAYGVMALARAIRRLQKIVNKLLQKEVDKPQQYGLIGSIDENKPQQYGLIGSIDGLNS